MDAYLKLIRMLRITMLAVTVGYSWLGERLRQPGKETSPEFFYAVTLLAILSIAAIVVVRRLTVARAENTLTTQPDDKAALTQWLLGWVATYAVSESVALFGLVLRIAGSSLPRVVPFYVVSFGLLFFYTPRRPSRDIG